MIGSLEQRLMQEIKARIQEDLDRLHRELGNGSQLAADAATTGMRCAKHMGAISGLMEALKSIDRAYDDLTGKVKKERAA